MKAARWWKRSFILLGSALICLVCLFPLYWAVNTSLKTGTELFSTDFVPINATIDNYRNIFKTQPFFKNILNSLLTASATVLFALLLSVSAAYALGRLKFKGRKSILFGFLFVSMFPQVAILSGLFEMVSAMGLYDQWFGLAVVYLIFTLPFTVWTLTTFIKDLPKSLEEAAFVDGASTVRVIFSVLLPLIKPALITTGLLAFIAAWNEFLFALTLTLTDTGRTIPVAIGLMSGSSIYELPWGNIMAASTVVTIPIVLLVLVFQRKIISGLTSGAVKG